jgi:hypothetical protein
MQFKPLQPLAIHSSLYKESDGMQNIARPCHRFALHAQCTWQASLGDSGGRASSALFLCAPAGGIVALAQAAWERLSRKISRQCTNHVTSLNETTALAFDPWSLAHDGLALGMHYTNVRTA